MSIENNNEVTCCFNVHVDCKEHECKNCGWNPVVAKERTNRIKAKMKYGK